MAYADIYNAATDAMFQGRCLAAVWKAAQDITAEDPQTANHASRYDWAVTVLRDLARITPRQLAIAEERLRAQGWLSPDVASAH